jgi:NitT/TauT family transport system substrate-binding protein
MEEINNNPDEARPYLKGYTSLDDNLVSKAPMPIFKVSSQLTLQDKSSIQKFYDIFTKYKVVGGKINFDNLVYSNSN